MGSSRYRPAFKGGEHAVHHERTAHALEHLADMCYDMSKPKKECFYRFNGFYKIATGIKKGDILEFMEIDSFMLNEISKSKINSMAEGYVLMFKGDIMKKLLAMFLSFFLVVPTTSYAFDNEVTFLGMRFGQATPEQAVEVLVSNGYEYGNIRVEADTSIWTLYSDNESTVYPYADTGSNPGGIGIDYYFGRGSEIKVAGHPIFSQDLYFLYEVVDGQINKDKATFVKASYRFQSLEQHALYNDLLSKLTKLYGEPELYEHKQEYINSNTKIISVATWKGLNDTAIVLSMEWRTVDGVIKIPTDYIGDDWVNLKYGLIDTSEKMIEIKAIYDKLALEAEKQRIEDSKDDTGGL